MSQDDGRGKPPGGPPPGWQPLPPQYQQYQQPQYPQGQPPQQHAHQQPYQPPTAPRRTHLIATVQAPQGAGFWRMAVLSLKRALRLRIEPNEVLADERARMLAVQPPITDETQQAFMAWRRSVLFMAALLMIPVAVLHAIDNLNFREGIPDAIRAILSLQVLVEVGFAVFLWTQLPRWILWRRQSRALWWAWVVYFLTPFLVFLYPFATDLAESNADGDAMKAVAAGLGGALVALAPKVISLLQGMIRASIATKTLFPGASAPGWLMVLCAPLYAVIFYVLLLLPYQLTGSGFAVVGLIAILLANASLVGAGLGLTRPMLPEVARVKTRRTLSVWMTLLIGGVVAIGVGLRDLLVELPVLSVINFVLSMASSILILTLIATDTVITGLDRARGSTPEERALADEAHQQIASFTGAWSQG